MLSTHLPDSEELMRFRRNEQATARLAELMSDPVLRQALDIVARLAIPTGVPEATPGLHPDTNTAHYAHLLIGVGRTIAKLQKMTVYLRPGVEESESPDREEFSDWVEHLQPLTRQ